MASYQGYAPQGAYLNNTPNLLAPYNSPMNQWGVGREQIPLDRSLSPIPNIKSPTTAFTTPTSTGPASASVQTLGTGTGLGKSLYGGDGGFGGLSYGQWATTGLQSLGSFLTAFGSYNQSKAFKKQVNHNIAMDTQNMRNAVQDYGRRLEERYTTAYAGRGDMSEQEAKDKAKQYRKENELKSL